MSEQFLSTIEGLVSPQLKKPEHRKVLRDILEWVREGGGDAVTDNIKQLVDEIVEEKE
jgi:hypothetical protein